MCGGRNGINRTKTEKVKSQNPRPLSLNSVPSALESHEERIPSGILGLDAALDGGFPEGTMISLGGDIGTGTSTFCLQVVWSWLTTGGAAAYFCVDDPPETVVNHFKSYGWNVERYIEKKQLTVFDTNTVTSHLSSKPEGQNGVAERRALLGKYLGDVREQLHSLGTNNNTALPTLGVIDSLSSVAPYIDLRSAYVFAHMIAEYIRKSEDLLIAVVHTGAFEANIVCACNSVADGIIRLESALTKGEVKRQLRIEKMAFTQIPPKTLEYKITSKNGIKIITR
ncbi:MAG: RAD55 family ATPase [Candidatus Atabeyarchaeum deiterrae]